jgi:asparagine synthase (glutamine-hydrolysing)
MFVYLSFSYCAYSTFKSILLQLIAGLIREAFRDLLPEKIANREKLRFAMGTGMDDVMDDIISKIIDPKEFERRPKAAYGLPFASFKELYYYDEFLQLFPPSYEKQTVRWDPFK